MPDTDTIPAEELLRMTSEVAAAYVSNNNLPSGKALTISGTIVNTASIASERGLAGVRGRKAACGERTGQQHRIPDLACHRQGLFGPGRAVRADHPGV